MSFQIFSEDKVAEAITKKAPIREKSGKRSPHRTCFIEHEDIVIDHMRIPNKHKRDFYKGKASSVADKLKLSAEEYNEFVKCDLKKERYLEILSKYIKDNKLKPPIKAIEKVAKKGK